MRFRYVAAVGLLAISATSVQAQGGGAPVDPGCAAGPALTRDACQQTVDMFDYLAPLLGTAIVGGNPTMAQGGSLGSRLGLIPHVTVGVRLNAVMAGFPELQTPSPTLQQRAANPVSTGVIPLPAVDFAIGVFKGVPLALSNVGGIDLLLSAAYIPEVSSGDVTITPDSPLKIGYGVRIGLLQESLVVPGLGFSFMKRDMPTTTIVGSTTGATFTVKDLALKTTAWRITASKSLLLFGVALGVGQDSYDASTSILATTAAGNVGPFSVKSEVKRTNYFADLSMNLPFIKLVGTGGMVSGGEILTHNGYETPADKSRVYGSAGIRLTF